MSLAKVTDYVAFPLLSAYFNPLHPHSRRRSVMGCSSGKGKICTTTIRIALVGESGSGKSALLHAILRLPFEAATSPRAGSNVAIKTFAYQDSLKLCSIEVWELSGLTPVSTDFHYVILTLDSSLTSSQLNEQFVKFDNAMGLRKRLGRFIIALTKADIAGGGAEGLSVGWHTKVYVTSAKTRLGVDSLLQGIAMPGSIPVSRRTSLSSIY